MLRLRIQHTPPIADCFIQGSLAGAPRLLWKDGTPDEISRDIMERHGYTTVGAYSYRWYIPKVYPDTQRIVDNCLKTLERYFRRVEGEHAETLCTACGGSPSTVECADCGYFRYPRYATDKPCGLCPFSPMSGQKCNTCGRPSLMNPGAVSQAMSKMKELVADVQPSKNYEIEQLKARITFLEKHIEVLKLEAAPSAVEKAKPIHRGVVIHCQNEEDVP